MRKVLAFLVWLFSFWTWIQDFFLRWLRRPPFYPPSGETAGSEHLPSQEGQPESELARFLSSLPEDERWCGRLAIEGDSVIELTFGLNRIRYRPDMQAGYREFLGAVASSEVVFRETVWVDVYGDNYLKPLEAFADALRQSGNALRKLVLYCSNVTPIPLAKCISGLLLGNDAIQNLHLYFGRLNGKMGKVVAEELVTIVGVPHILQILTSLTFNGSFSDREGIVQLMKSFTSLDNVLEYLHIHQISSIVELEHIAGLLAISTSLRKLTFRNLSRTYTQENIYTRGYTSIASALCSNQSLQFLGCGITNSMELKALLDPLMPKTNNPQSNTTLTSLRLEGTIGGKQGIETIVAMLRTNESLVEIIFWDLYELSFKDAEAIKNVLAILEALKTNKCLKKIDFNLCSAVGGYEVLGAMMDLLLENHCIEDIDLIDTPLQRSGDDEYVYSALSKRKKMKLWGIVQGMANVKPTSGRVFLCGQPFAGKTRLRLSMKQLKEFQQNDEIQKTSRIRNRMRRAFKSPKVPTVPKEDILLERTQGIEVDNVLCDDIHISIWDMAGQTDYHSFHELVMPNFSADGSCSIFLLMCNPMEQLDPSKRRSLTSLKEELEYWLRFIASNTRRSNSYRPHVSIVMTHFDYWKNDGPFATCIEEEVLKFKIQFQEVLEFDDDKIIFKVDGTNIFDAHKVFDFLKLHLKQLLERLPQTISACEEVQRLLVQWNADKSKPLLKWQEFCESMCKDVEDFNIANHELATRRKEFVALSLNDGGHIIYNEKEGVVITNPHWFCHHIMGQFLHQCTNQGCQLDMVSSNGVMSIAHVKCFILDLLSKEGDSEKKFDDILGMMKKLHICYEQDGNNILIPSTLRHTNKTLNWCEVDEPIRFKYVGRRLACQDGFKTMLTIGFFTRLQVSFFKMLQNSSDQRTYKVFQDVIKFINAGIEVILQFNHGDIDIFSRSDQSQDQMLAFLEINRIINHIKQHQEDPTLGCPGVRLTEYILRPECVKKLLSPMDRKTQVVHVKDLEVKVINEGSDAKHSWGSCEGLDVGYHTVKTLLGDVAYHNLLVKRTCQLQEYHQKIQSLDSSTQNDPSLYDIKIHDVSTIIRWQMPWDRLYGALDVKLDNIIRMQKQHQEEIISKLDNIVEMIQSLEYDIKDMQKDLLHKVCLRMDDLMAFSVEMKTSQIPKVAYLSDIGNCKLLTQFVPGLDTFKLHLMCESIHGFHPVANQEGCVVYFGREDIRRFLAMLAYGLKIVTILTKIGAHVACGMGAMVPDFSDGCNFAALIFDTPGFLDYPIPKVTLESLPIEAGNVSRLSIDDTFEAQRWLRTFLEPKSQNKREFYEKFKLTKVKYRDSAGGSVAWICDKCLSKQDDRKDVLN